MKENRQSINSTVSGSVISDRPTWREQDGVIYFSVTSDGTTGPQWIERFKQKNTRISDEALEILRSSGFTPTRGVTTKIAMLQGTKVFTSHREIVTAIVLDEGKRQGLKLLATEVACLIRNMFTVQDMEVMGVGSIVTMHAPLYRIPRLQMISCHSLKNG